MNDRIDELRRQISENDRAIVDALNTRLELVARIKQEKAARGIEFEEDAEPSDEDIEAKVSEFKQFLDTVTPEQFAEGNGDEDDD